MGKPTAKMSNLEIIQSTEITWRALSHPNIKEAIACGMIMEGGKNDNHGGVIGTQNTRKAELYGWHNPVRPHIDTDSGPRWIYGMVIATKEDLVIGAINYACGGINVIHPKPGDIYRLNDREAHWTEGTAETVAIFTGCYENPNDDQAIQILTRGLQRLENGVYNAPRVQDGFRILQPQECWATKDFNSKQIMRIATAKRLGYEILECADCDKPAQKIDTHWPYYYDENKCAECIGKDNG